MSGRTRGQQGEDIHQSNQTAAWGHLEDGHANSQKAHSEYWNYTHYLLQNEIKLMNIYRLQKSAIAYFQRICPNQKLERIFMDWCWWILAGLPFQHLVRIMDCYFHEGIKVLYRVALVILNLFHKECQSNNEWSPDNIKNDIGNALIKFCKKIPVSPAKLLHTAFSIRGLRLVCSVEYI